MSKKSKEVNDYIREQYSGLSDKTKIERNKIIKDRVSKKFNIILDKDDIYVAVKLLKKQGEDLVEDLHKAKTGIDRLGQLFTDEDPEVKEKNGKKFLILRVKNTEPETGESYEEPVAVSMETIDEIYNDYVHHGLNMSGQAVMDKWGIPGKAWGMLKNRLGLNKNQNIVSDITLRGLSEDDLSDKADEMVSEHFFNRHKKIVKNAYDKHMKALLNRYSTNETFLHHFREFITKHYDPKPIIIPDVVIDNNDMATVDFGDIHFGKVKTENILYRLGCLKSNIISMPERVIYLKCYGDIVEAISQEGMHKGQMAYGMEQKWGFGFDLLMFAVNTMEQFLSDLHKAGKEVHFIGIPGNHDRLDSDKEKDIKKSGGMIIYEMIKRGLSQSKIEIDYLREQVSTFDIGNARYIIAHGDGVFDKIPPERIIVLYGDTSKYNIIISADKHHFSMKEGIIYLWIKTPALAGPGQYDISMFLGSEPGYMTFKDNQWGTTGFSLNRLPNDKYIDRQ